MRLVLRGGLLLAGLAGIAGATVGAVGIGGASEPPRVPLHLRPPDLVSVDLGRFRDDLAGRRIAGRVRAVSLQPWSGVPTFECTLVDGTGALTIAFLGRREVPGIEPGTKLVVEGAIGSHHGRLAMLNPLWEFLEPLDRHGSVSTG